MGLTLSVLRLLSFAVWFLAFDSGFMVKGLSLISIFGLFAFNYFVCLLSGFDSYVFNVIIASYLVRWLFVIVAPLSCFWSGIIFCSSAGSIKKKQVPDMPATIWP